MSNVELGQNEEHEPYNSDVVRETTENGQVVWLNSSPEEKATDEATSSQESQSPEV